MLTAASRKFVCSVPRESDDEVVELSSLAMDPGGSGKTRTEATRIIRSNLQLLLRLGFTLVAIVYFATHSHPPLLFTRLTAVTVGALFFMLFLFFHYLPKRRGFDSTLIQVPFLLDITGSHLAWLVDPWNPSAMLMLILVTAVGNGAHHGYKNFRRLFKITVATAPVVYLLRVYLIGFHPAALLFMTLAAFVLIYIYVLIHNIDILQRRAEKKAADLYIANQRLNQTGQALQDSEARYRSMFEHSATATALIEENMRIALVNAKFEELTRYSKKELCHQKKLTDFIHEKDMDRIRRFHYRRQALGGIAPTEYECQLVDKHGNIKHTIIRLSIMPWHERIIATIVDITSRKQAKAALQKYNTRLQELAHKFRQSETRYRSLFENTGTATILVEKNLRISMANTKFTELTGYSREEISGGKRLSEFIERRSLYRIRKYHNRLKDKGLPLPDDYECLILDKSRGLKHVVMKVHTPPGQKSSIVSFFDITTRKMAEAALQKAHEKLQTLAVCDDLTQVANRRRFDEFLQREWSRLKREVRSLSLIMCDIDCFKEYNDTYGHQSGDECLREIAGAIKTVIKRSVDLAARYGGEEFAIIMPNTEAEGALKVAESLRMAVENLNISHKASSVSPFVTMSLGVSSLVPTHDLGPEHLIRDADTALYEAKRKGRNRTVGGKGAHGFTRKIIRADNLIRLN